MQPLGQAEIGDTWLVLCVDQHVRGFEVAMQNSSFVRIVNGVSNGFKVAHYPANPWCIAGFALGIQFGEALAFDEIHHEEWLSLVRADFMDRDNVRVL